MGVNVKMAFGMCLAFIAGMSWLVNEVALPTVASDTASVAANAELWRRGTGVDLNGRFVRESLVETETAANRAALPVSALAPTIAGAGQGSLLLPPLLAMAAGTPIESPAPEFATPVEPQVAIDWYGPAKEPVSETSSDDVLIPAAGHSAPRIVLAAETSGRTAVPDAADAVPALREGTYTVRSGDSLARIAKRAWNRSDPAAVQALLAANPILRGRADHVRLGQMLTIPAEPGTPARVAASIVRSAASGDKSVPTPTERAGRKTAAAAKPATPAPRWYTIQKNESLEAVARRVLNDGRRWRELAELNNIRDSKRITPGMRIKLPKSVALAQS